MVSYIANRSIPAQYENDIGSGLQALLHLGNRYHPSTSVRLPPHNSLAWYATCSSPNPPHDPRVVHSTPPIPPLKPSDRNAVHSHLCRYCTPPPDARRTMSRDLHHACVSAPAGERRASTGTGEEKSQTTALAAIARHHRPGSAARPGAVPAVDASLRMESASCYRT